ncbi:hypothetical protein B9479_005846 [Cryptococcus floricola]|uniref:Uncharacterized protein n=1 Tax=Cryptococcus floricola TaxID=2591691 RepID=A0A5D3APY1_9TREE|nr:hypothetical protein B9479_005846 [Cryptococcus floricola]
MTSSLLSPNNHTRHSHYLAPHQPAASHNGGFKASLRKIPSALFHKSPIRDRPTKGQVSAEPSVSHPQSMSPSLRVPKSALDTDAGTKSKLKNKNKPRKALAELFGWGHNTNTQPITSPAPAPPSKPINHGPTPRASSTMLRKANRPPSTKSTSTSISLRPAEPVMPSRPSMSDDPFMRADVGAEVVDNVFRHGTPSLRSQTPMDRRSSVASSKALSYKTVSDERHSKEVQERPPHMTTIRATQQPRQVSAPLPPHIASDLPPAPTSLGRALGSAPLVFAPLPGVPEAPPAVVVEAPKKTLKKEKTKSKVWGLLGRSKSKKSKAPVEAAPPVPALPTKESWGQSSGPTQSTTSLVSKMDEKYASATARTNYSSLRTSRVPVPAINATARSGSTLSGPRSEEGTVIYESVVGSTHDRPSTDGPRQAIEALMGPTRLPKRKSLTGLFGLGSRKSTDKLKASSPGRAASSPPRMMGQPTLRSLKEETEDAAEPVRPAKTASLVSKQAPKIPTPKADVFTCRFGSLPLNMAARAEVPKNQGGIRRVTSATDKLLNLVHAFDFSPASSRSPTLHHMSSSNTLRADVNGSPTPLRKVRSAMLGRPSANSLKPSSANISPLKLALNRSQAAANSLKFRKAPELAENPAETMAPTPSPPRQSLVRKGMRNIFAPPSPVSNAAERPMLTPVVFTSAKINDETVGMGINFFRHSSEPTVKVSDGSDLPFDLKPVVANTDAAKAQYSPSKTAKLGLPTAPPQNRVTPRRTGFAPPALFLPPVPNVGLPELEQSTPVPEATAEYNNRDSMFSDMLTAGPHDQHRDTFDFTSEYQALDQGIQRHSFVEALRKVGSVQMFMGGDLPPLPTPSHEALKVSPTEQVPSFHISKPSDGTSLDNAHDDDSDGEEDDEDEAFGDDEGLEETAEIHHVMGIAKTSPVRREPFKGQVSFQQQMTMHSKASVASFGAPEPALPEELPALPAVPDAFAPTHRRGQSSVATMSSIGSVIGVGTEREYTNYFDYAVPQQQSHSRAPSVTETVEEIIDELPERSPSRQAMANFKFGAQLSTRPTTRRSHHRRNSSIASVDSVGGVDLHNVIHGGPPVSMHNKNRSSYVSRHRRGMSGESSFGRPDWAAHRRNTSSVASTSSNVSVSQIVRPGLGDRMFTNLDGGVKLTSITGSPPDESKANTAHQRTASWDSLFDATQAKMVQDSIFDVSRSKMVDDSLFGGQDSQRDSFLSSGDSSRMSADADSLFGPEQSSSNKNFVLRGLRPVSTISTDTSNSAVDDTFADSGNVAKKIEEYERCLQAEGEDVSNMTPLGKKMAQPINGRQMLGSSMSRPAKPNRRRPHQLVFSDVPMDTPGLTSPSASESSSRVSLDTNAASLILGGARARGHCRQTSSAQVNVGATIHEVPSIATLRPKKASNSPEHTRRSVLSQHEPTIMGVDMLESDDEIDKVDSVRSWVQWEREAMDEFRKTKNVWRDSEESKMAISDWKMPQTSDEIAAFLAQSSQAYKPLEQEQLPAGRTAHRRKSSLQDARSMCSPYGLPLPKPAPVNKPKMSLTTKYEKKSSTGSKASTAPSAFSFAFFPDDVPEAPSTAPLPTTAQVTSPLASVFAPFARETPASPPPTLAPFKPVSPFQLPTLDAFGLRKCLEDKTGKANVQKEEAKKEADGEKRKRVDSKARRQALGWGRRRDSDGPDKVVAIGHAKMASEVPKKPILFKPLQNKASVEKKAKGGKDKENSFRGEKSRTFTVKGQESAISRPQPLKAQAGNRSPTKRKPAPRYVASQPTGLRI